MNFTDRIKPTDKGITTYLDELKGFSYQIPTFQRDVVWEKENVKKLWDSIYKFYPLGSILVWKTDIKLQNHRHIGGHQIADNHSFSNEFQYLLDGQQRTTSLLTSLYGGTIKGGTILIHPFMSIFQLKVRMKPMMRFIENGFCIGTK